MVRKRIIEESGKLFMQYGVKISMDDIAKHLGISKRTIYENFKDKNELLAESIEYLFYEADELAKRIFEKADNVLEASLQLVSQQEKWGKQQGIKFAMEIKKYFPDVYKNQLTTCHEKRRKNMEQFIEQGVAEGVFRSDVNPALTAFMFSEQTNLVFLDQFQQFSDSGSLNELSASEMFKELMMNFVRGISTPKGIEILEKYIHNKKTKTD